MVDFINRTELRLKLLNRQLEAQENGSPELAWGMEMIRKVVEKEPAADVAPVVRCKDCERWRKRNPARMEESYYCAECGWCDRLDNPVMPDAFCSRGKRKKG